LICAFNQLLDLKDLNTGVHSTRLAEWALHVAGELGLEGSSLSDIEVAALLHDIGKIGIPDAILQKPAKLTEQEYDLMKKHPEYGWAVLRNVPGMERASLIILHHHESFDGRGYPAGLKGEEIPVGSRIVSVIDSFDAMVSSRPYREGLPFEEAERRLLQARGTQFDPEVVDRFLPLARAEMSAVFAAAGTSVSASL
jgi:HD-GYP domain-containing protein (c-di-GMP phosphodiesterase class II)